MKNQPPNLSLRLARRMGERINPAHLIVVQPAVPTYRLGLFERLARLIGPEFSVHASASAQDMGVLTERIALHDWERRLGPIKTLFPGVQWQSGTVAIPIQRGDIVIVSGAPRCLSNVLLLLKARLKGAHAIWWGHYWSSTSRPWRAGIRLLIAQISDALLFYTDREVAEYARRKRGTGKTLVFALNNGIETSEIDRLRTRYDPTLRSRRLLFIGRVTAKAEIALLLRALAEPPCVDVSLQVIGSGQEEARARELAATLGVIDRVDWHGPITDEPKIAAITNRCALFVYPGSVGLSLIHGLSYGLPAIVHDDPWSHSPEIAAFENGRNGLSFKKNDPRSLAESIACALSDPDRLKHMSATAIETTTCTFNTRDMAERFCAAIAAVQNADGIIPAAAESATRF